MVVIAGSIQRPNSGVALTAKQLDKTKKLPLKFAIEKLEKLFLTLCMIFLAFYFAQGIGRLMYYYDQNYNEYTTLYFTKEGSIVIIFGILVIFAFSEIVTDISILPLEYRLWKAEEMNKIKMDIS